MINLLPYKEKRSIEKVRFAQMVKTVVMALFLIITTSFVLIAPTWITVSSRYKIASDQVVSLENEGKITNGVNLTSLQERAVTLQSKLNSESKTSPTKFLAIVRSLVPSGITIDRYATVGSSQVLEVTGISRSRELLQKFIADLSSESAVALVDNPVSNFIKNKNGNFKLTITFK